MKKILFIAIWTVAITVAMSMCVCAETVFETEKIIQCKNAHKTPLSSTTFEGSISDTVFQLAGSDVIDPAMITEPELSFNFYVPEDGNYTMYLHGAFPGGGSDSYFYKFDDNPWKDVHPSSKGNTLYWSTVVTNHYLTAGLHTFHLHHRESGTFFDCFSIIKSDGEFKIIINGATLESDVPPYVENGISMVPFRAFSEALGAEVTWDGEKRAATITTDKLSLTVVENSKEAYFRKFPVQLESPARIINGRFMVPVRFVAGNLQYSINWIPQTNHTFIEKIK